MPKTNQEPDEYHTHTPGPWTIEKANQRHALHYVVSADGKDIAHVCNSEAVPSPQSDYNGLLLAAAPFMLESLEAIKALAPALATHIHTICDNAIAKARGEE